MSKTKKFNSPEEYLLDQIKQETNQGTIFVSDHTCDHSLAYHTQFNEFDDGWQYSRMFCPGCNHSWDAWQAPRFLEWNLVLNITSDTVWPTDGPVGNNGPS
jgi:hypothetical protein